MPLLAACGQKGPLYIPDTPAARQRATLPQTVYGVSGTRHPAAAADQQAPAAPDTRPDDLPRLSDDDADPE